MEGANEATECVGEPSRDLMEGVGEFGVGRNLIKLFGRQKDPYLSGH